MEIHEFVVLIFDVWWYINDQCKRNLVVKLKSKVNAIWRNLSISNNNQKNCHFRRGNSNSLVCFLSASIASRFYISIFPTGYYLSFPRHFYQFKTFLNKSQHSIQNYFEHFWTFIEVTWFQINFESYVSKLIWISKLRIGHNLFVLIKLALLDWKPFQSC